MYLSTNDDAIKGLREMADAIEAGEPFEPFQWLRVIGRAMGSIQAMDDVLARLTQPRAAGPARESGRPIITVGLGDPAELSRELAELGAPQTPPLRG